MAEILIKHWCLYNKTIYCMPNAISGFHMVSLKFKLQTIDPPEIAKAFERVSNRNLAMSSF